MPKILLVEDDPNIREPLADYLTQQGYQISQAENLQKAEAFLKEMDLAVFDWNVIKYQWLMFISQIQEPEPVFPEANKDYKVSDLQLRWKKFNSEPYDNYDQQLISSAILESGSDTKVLWDHLIRSQSAAFNKQSYQFTAQEKQQLRGALRPGEYDWSIQFVKSKERGPMRISSESIYKIPIRIVTE